MKTRKLLITLSGIMTAGLLALGAGTALAQSPPGGGPFGVPIHQFATDLDAHFIEEMIPHHEDAVVMAGLALAQAEHPELRTLAESIRRTQTDEIAQMQQWYLAWYGTTVAPSWMDTMMGGGFGHMMGWGGMAGHDPTVIDGQRPFDKAFIEQMIPHHEQAVMMSSMMLQGVQQPELRQLLQDIITSQSAEIAQMRQWYEEWYGAPVPSWHFGAMHGGAQWAQPGPGTVPPGGRMTPNTPFGPGMMGHHRFG